MASRVVAVYLSEHGFGHAVRSVIVLRRLLEARPDVHLKLATGLPAWLLADLETTGRAERVEAMALAPPLVQHDSLAVDHERSCDALARATASFAEDLSRHAAWLQEIDAKLAYCDIPPLPVSAARRAGVPGIALGNFTWDWIYERYADRDQRYAAAARQAAAAYGEAQLYLRLPTAPRDASAMPVEEVPWVGRHPRRSPEEVRRALQIEPSLPLVLLSFGGHPGIPVAELAHSDWARQVQLVGGRQLAATGPAVMAVDEAGLADQGIEYIDLVAAADVVVSKPGYGMLADCLFAGSRLVYLARPEFPEASLLLEPAMERLLGAVAIGPGDRTAAGIARAVDEALSKPRPSTDERLDGVEVAVAKLAELLG
ncbi:MAG: hypothetical protein JRI23_16815 [Deltaproteobacteria bacterium]|jgi:L-arabinokinase|nr:hypothetical protein [Deltaproteobacteria bacterium]MBW2533457.1 hypothetical protein [Deltaproteobacteria bacterium]